MKSILFVLGGLAIGGVETYIVRLAREINSKGWRVDVLLISKKNDGGLLSELSKFANVFVWEKVPFLNNSSWINAFLPLKWCNNNHFYDIVHVVDLLTLGHVRLNSDAIRYKALSIGIYHSMEIVWWRDRNPYFRKKLLELYDRNVRLTLFPNESTAFLAAQLTGVPVDCLNIVPLGIDFSKYAEIGPSATSKRIVSIGRLVDFKTYNKHLISQLSEIRQLGDFEYYVYGGGPELIPLKVHAGKCGVAKHVHFKGEVPYEDLPNILNGAFCFVGSGTTIIEASAAGIPSIIGIESLEAPMTCGLFSQLEGYSYNEEFATTNRILFVDAIRELFYSSDDDYRRVSRDHRAKASKFDIKNTVTDFLGKSDSTPEFGFSFNRWSALISVMVSIVRFGPKALKSRFLRAKET